MGTITNSSTIQTGLIRITKATAKAAPLDIPSKDGSAKGFLNNACVIAPARPRLAPTDTANRPLGTRISQRIWDVCHSAIDKDVGPTNIDPKKQILKAMLLISKLGKEVLS